jgi:predicted house-cleaning noncanonical NTP pyrophosphatase (MazG superfamily)
VDSGKLIRDRIPEIIGANGDAAGVRRLRDAEYVPALLSKLVEETDELAHAESRQERLQEAADVYEVLVTIAQIDGYTMDEVQAAADQKRAVRGGFEDKLWLDTDPG